MEAHFIDLIPERETPVYHVSQGDNERVIRCNLFDGVEAYTLTGTESVRLRYRRMDGSISSISVPNTSGTYVNVTLPEDLTAVIGRVYCKLRINSIGAKAFYVDVEGRP